MRAAAIVLLAVLVTGCASAPPRKAAVACIAADLATTAYGLSRGLEEQNHPGLVLGGTVLYLSWGGDHPTADRVVAGTRCAMAAWNVSRISR